MSKTSDPFFSVSVANIAAKATAAKTTMTDNANAVLAFTAGAEGAIVNTLKARALGTFTDTVIYAFTSSDGGTTLHLKAAVKVTGATVSTTAVTPSGDLGPTYDEPWQLNANERLYVAASVVLAAGWEFEGSAENF
jgi:hypothetical protein